MVSAIQARPAGVLVPPPLRRVQVALRPGTRPPSLDRAGRRSTWATELRADPGRSGIAGQSAGWGTAGMSAHCPDIPATAFPSPTAAITSKATWSPWVAVTVIWLVCRPTTSATWLRISSEPMPGARRKPAGAPPPRGAGDRLQRPAGGAERTPAVDRATEVGVERLDP